MCKPGQNPFVHVKPHTIDRVLSGGATTPTYIAHDACEGDPYYNGDDPVKDKTSRGDATINPTVPTDSGWDSPGGPMDGVKGNIVRIDIEFETCAVPGARVRLGASVGLEITRYTSPCINIRTAFANRDYSRVSQKVHPGWSRLYARVLVEGRISEDEPARLLSAQEPLL